MVIWEPPENDAFSAFSDKAKRSDQTRIKCAGQKGQFSKGKRTCNMKTLPETCMTLHYLLVLTSSLWSLSCEFTSLSFVSQQIVKIVVCLGRGKKRKELLIIFISLDYASPLWSWLIHMYTPKSSLNHTTVNQLLWEHREGCELICANCEPVLSHTWAHRCSWLGIVTLIDRGESVYHNCLPENLASFAWLVSWPWMTVAWSG